MFSGNVYLCEGFLVVGYQLIKLVHRLYGNYEGIIKVIVSVCISVFKLGISLALRALEAVTGYSHKRIVTYLEEAAVKDSSLVVHRHSEGGLTYHFLEYRLIGNEASVARKLGESGEVVTGERAHLVRGFTAADTSRHLIVNCKRYLISAHNSYRLIELLRVYDEFSFFYDLCLDSGPHTLFKIVCGEYTGIRHFSFNKDTFYGREHRFSRNRAHKRRHRRHYS